MSEQQTRFASPIATGDAALMPAPPVPQPVQLVDAKAGVPIENTPAPIKGQDVQVGDDGEIKIDGKALEGTLQSPAEHKAAKAAAKKNATATPKKDARPGLVPNTPESESGSDSDPEVDTVGPAVQDPHPATAFGEPGEDKKA